jgi:hypothetical protein
MSNCGNLYVTDAEGLVEDKFNYAEKIANDSIILAKDALSSLLSSAEDAIRSAGTVKSPLGASGGGNADVSYSSPEAPILPELLFSVDRNVSNTSGLETPPILNISDVPVKSFSKPNVLGTSFNLPIELSDFSDTFTDTTNISFVAPLAPPDFSSRFSAPPTPSFTNLTAPANFNGIAPVVTAHSEPTLTAQSPGAMPAILTPNYPQAPEIAQPADPQKYSISLPTLRIPDLSGIDGLLSSMRSSKPSEPVLSLPDSEYLDTFNTMRGVLGDELNPVLQIEEVITWLLDGRSTGLSANVAALLRDRAFAAEDQLAFQAESTAIGDWLSRGFTLPGGALSAQINQIRQQNHDKKAELNRNLWIEEAKFEIENLRFAVTSGIQYQTALWDSKLKLWGICSELSNKFIDVQLRVLEANLMLFKSRLEAWQTEANIYKDYISAKLQVELGKLEITKVEADVSKLFVEMNKQEVELFRARIEGSMAVVNLYKTQIDAANGHLQAETLKLEAFAKQVQAYTASVGAYEAEWRGYAAAVQADGAKVEAFKAQVQAYGANVDAYGKQIDAEKTRVSAQIEVGQFALEAYKADAAVYNTRVEAYSKAVIAEQARVSGEVEIAKLPLEAYKAKSQAYAAQADAYGKRVQAVASKVAAETEIAKLPIDIYKSEVQAYVAEVDGYGKTVQAKQTEVMSYVELEKLKLLSFQAELDAYKAELQKAAMELDASAKVHNSQVQLFGVLVESEKANVSAKLQNIDQALRQTQHEASVQLRQAELEQTQVIELAKLAISADGEVGRVASQLAGAALSAVNASASISTGYSAGRSVSCSENYNYDMSQ